MGYAYEHTHAFRYFVSLELLFFPVPLFPSVGSMFSPRSLSKTAKRSIFLLIVQINWCGYLKYKVEQIEYLVS